MMTLPHPAPSFRGSAGTSAEPYLLGRVVPRSRQVGQNRHIFPSPPPFSAPGSGQPRGSLSMKGGVSANVESQCVF
jgi:hypothetical protein